MLKNLIFIGVGVALTFSAPLSAANPDASQSGGNQQAAEQGGSQQVQDKKQKLPKPARPRVRQRSALLPGIGALLAAGAGGGAAAAGSGGANPVSP